MQTSTRTYTRWKLESGTECCSYPKSFAFRGTVYVWWVTLPFLEWFEFVSVVVVFHGNCCCHTSGIWWNGSQIPGVHTQPEYSSSPHPAKDVEKHWAEGVVALAWWLCRGDEVWFAMVEFLGVSLGLLQTLAVLRMLYPGNSSPPCGGGKSKKRAYLERIFLTYQGILISTALFDCLFKPKITKLEVEVNQNPTEFLRVAPSIGPVFFRYFI